MNYSGFNKFELKLRNLTTVFQQLTRWLGKKEGGRCACVFSKRFSSSAKELGKYKVVFLGNDSFSLPSLVGLVQHLGPGNVTVVVSNWNNVVSKFAKRVNCKIYLWEEFRTAEFGDKLLLQTEGKRDDFGVVASFGHLIPARVINRYPLGILNVHASLLPRWRGASPIAHAIMSGDTETGVSIMKIAPHKFDIGPVLLMKSVPLDPHIRSPELHTLLADTGASALIEVIRDLRNYLKNPVQQDNSLATLAPKLTPEIADVDWPAKTALDVYRLFRSLYGTYKLKTNFNNRSVDLDEIELVSTDGVNGSTHSSTCTGSNIKLPEDSKPGQIFYVKENIYVCCASVSGRPSWIRVNKLKIGTKWISGKDFKNGFLSKGKLPKGALPQFEVSVKCREDEQANTASV